MKKYLKTDWQDGVTPVNARNLGKIESELAELAETSITPGDLVGSEGVSVEINESGKVEVSTPDAVQSKTFAGIEFVQGSIPEVTNQGVLYFIMDGNSLKSLYIGGIKIHEFDPQ